MLAALLGPVTLAALMLVWGAFFYHGYGEDAPRETQSIPFILASWIASILVAVVCASRLHAWPWVAGAFPLVAGPLIIVAMTITIGIAACADAWGSQTCLSS